MDTALHTRLADALLDPDRSPGLDAASDAAFDVHRNTATLGLLDALQQSYPTTRRLLGSEAFDAAALHHLRAHPPRTPVLIEWGHGFPQHLAAMQGMESWQWIADVARLESARRRAYHAEDHPRSRYECALGDKPGPPDARTHLALHPSAQTLRCASPVLEIWQSQNGLGDPPRPDDWRASQLIVWRRDETVTALRIDDAGRALLGATGRPQPIDLDLEQRPPLADALAEALDAGWLVLGPLAPPPFEHGFRP